MFKATKPFKDTVTGYDKEPSLRIGKKVPKDAVNLAYYFNPTATDAEKILTSDPPRQTIDHRVESQWLTKVNQASGPNGEEPSIDLFPKSIYYSDEEGYYGRLKRQDETVKWYPNQHSNPKEQHADNIQIVTKKGDEDKIIEYSDAEGYKGNLYLDASEYEIYQTKDVSVTEELDFTINNFEISYHDVFDSYLSSDDLHSGPWTNVPNPVSGEDYCWPARIEITAKHLRCSDTGLPTTNTNNQIANYINKLENQWDGVNEQHANDPNIISTSKPIGTLYFDKLEYEPVSFKSDPENGETPQEREVAEFQTDSFNWSVTADLENYTNHIPGMDKVTISGTQLKTSYLADAGRDYSQIQEFINILESRVMSDTIAIKLFKDAIAENNDIAIWMTSLQFVVNDESIDMLIDGSNIPGTDENEINAVSDPSPCYFKVKYKYMITARGKEGETLYNVIATYHSVVNDETGICSVRRTIKTNRKEAANYRAHCHYSGILDKKWVDYDGIAYYIGSVTKGNSVGNQNADDDNEILMFPDKDGYLRQIVEGLERTTDEEGRDHFETKYRDYYKIEADSVYVTDVFKDNVPCFYRYRLKNPIYDYRGPDENGFYKGDAVRITTSMLKVIPESYKHNMKLIPASYEERTVYNTNGVQETILVPKCYYADLFTSFISSSTDTFKVIYNGFNDIDDDNKVLNNGIEEDIYNSPFMINGIDYQIQSIDKKARLSRIQILNYSPLKDERLRITFKWKVVASNKRTGKSFISEVRQSSILNRDYCIPFEYDRFEDRGMIISPKLNGDSVYCSPRDLCLNDQAGYQTLDENYEPVITDTDTDFIYEVIVEEINEPGTVNIKCNPDGSGLITAETTVDTGFYDNVRNNYTKKLDIENPYWTDGEFIYQGYMVKCIDSRNIKIKAPREDNLLDSWYPLVQFGHYSRIMDQYNTHTKICYSMPEYDNQHYSSIYLQPYVDVDSERVTILNSHMVKTKCYPLFLLYDNDNKPGTIHLFKRIENDLYELHIKDVSFSDGVIIVEEAISENDNIIASYTYLEENYQYRGYWRDTYDFIRIDLNPNIYHTYNNPIYLPSEVSPSKNLFNKVIYFFMRPTAMYSVNEENGSFYFPNKKVQRPVTKTRPKYKQEKVTYYNIQYIDEDPVRIGTISTIVQNYSNNEEETAQTKRFILTEEYNGNMLISVPKRGSIGKVTIYTFGGVIDKDGNTDTNEIEEVYLQTVIEDFADTNTPEESIDIAISNEDFHFEMNRIYFILFENPLHVPDEYRDSTYEISYEENFLVKTCDLTANVRTEKVQDGIETYIEYEDHDADENDQLLSENECCLYHKIDDSEPNEDIDIRIGSVYIRQNTSLHSTIITDSRTRGGGILEAIPDSLRQELEPESDYYLDIGYYDGKPYQENGVIVVRLDNRLLKEYGGRFTVGDVEQKVKRWLGLGVYPIIEFVDSYKKEDLPQYTLEIEDEYANVFDETPEIFLECIAI